MIRTEDALEVEHALRSVRSAGEGPVIEELELAARAPHRAAARLATSKQDDHAAALSREVLTHTSSLAIAPLTEVTIDPKQRLFAIRTVATASLELFHRVSLWAQGSLADRDEIPKEIDGESEEDPPRERVCDVAYLALRRLHNVAEDPIRRSEEQRSFHALEFEERDPVIEVGRREGRFLAYRAETPEAE